MTFPLPPNEAVILAELQRLLDARIVEEYAPPTRARVDAAVAETQAVAGAHHQPSQLKIEEAA